MDADQTPGEAEHGPMGEWPTGRLLSTASRLVEHAWLDALAEHGLSHAGLIALHLVGEEPTNQTDLATRARVENQTMSRTLDRLEREGFIVTRTPAGAAAWESARNLERNVFPALTDVASFRSALLELITAGTASRWSGASRGE